MAAARVKMMELHMKLCAEVCKDNNAFKMKGFKG